MLRPRGEVVADHYAADVSAVGPDGLWAMIAAEIDRSGYAGREAAGELPRAAATVYAAFGVDTCAPEYAFCTTAMIIGFMGAPCPAWLDGYEAAVLIGYDIRTILDAMRNS